MISKCCFATATNRSQQVTTRAAAARVYREKVSLVLPSVYSRSRRTRNIVCKAVDVYRKLSSKLEFEKLRSAAHRERVFGQKGEERGTKRNEKKNKKKKTKEICNKSRPRPRLRCKKEVPCSPCRTSSSRRVQRADGEIQPRRIRCTCRFQTVASDLYIRSSLLAGGGNRNTYDFLIIELSSRVYDTVILFRARTSGPRPETSVKLDSTR